MPRIQEAPPSRPAYFWWFLLNILALCFAVTSWVGCLHVFGNPEIPRNYEILKRLGRVPEIRRYTAADAPNGASLNAGGLYGRFRGLDENKRKILNSVLLRNYMTNFEEVEALTYVEGDYRVEEVRLLKENDFIPRGFAVRARAIVRPDEHSKPAPYPVVIDCLFPTDQIEAMSHFRRGELLEIRKNAHWLAILQTNLMHDEDDIITCLTVTPIVYGAYQRSPDSLFEIAPPALLVPAAPFPVFAK